MVLLAACFLLLSFLLSGLESAFASANKIQLELMKKRGTHRAGVLASLIEKPGAFLGTLFFGNTLAMVVITLLLAGVLIPWLGQFVSAIALQILLASIVLMLVLLLVNDFLSRPLFRAFAGDALYLLVYPLRIFRFLLGGLAWVSGKLSRLLIRFITREPVEAVDNAFTMVDLENFIRESNTDNEGGEIDAELLDNALGLKDTRVRDCMVPRPEIESIDVNASVAELESLFAETKLSRILVIQDDIDNVLGYVHHQQLLLEPQRIRDLILDISFFPEVMRIADLMSFFIKGRLNIACVVDEFGGVAGLITLEDILEELFGEIEDEHDEEEYVERQLSDTEFLFSGRLEIDYLNEKYPSLKFPEGEYHTLSGYLVTTTETIPLQGVEITLEGKKFIFETVSETKIETVRIIQLPEEDE